MGPVEPPKGYVIPDRQSVEQILAIEAELLRSEGIDPAWPGFDDDSEHEADSPAPR